MNKETREKFNYFLISSFIFSLVLMLITGIITVERNTRYVAFGDTKPFLEYNFKKGKPKFIKFVFFGKEIKI